MNDYETQRQAVQERQTTPAEWWAAHPEEHQPRASRALGFMIVGATIMIVALLAWILL